MCEEVGLKHLILNESRWIKDRQTGFITNAVERQNDWLKMGIPARDLNKKTLVFCITWSRKKQKTDDLWEEFFPFFWCIWKKLSYVKIFY